MEKHPKIVEKIHNYGFEIGHSHLHIRWRFDQNPREFREDLNTCVNTLEDIISDKVLSYRAPGFLSPRKTFGFMIYLMN